MITHDHRADIRHGIDVASVITHDHRADVCFQQQPIGTRPSLPAARWGGNDFERALNVTLPVLRSTRRERRPVLIFMSDGCDVNGNFDRRDDIMRSFRTFGGEHRVEPHVRRNVINGYSGTDIRSLRVRTTHMLLTDSIHSFFNLVRQTSIKTYSDAREHCKNTYLMGTRNKYVVHV